MNEEPSDHIKWVYKTNASRAERGHNFERECGNKNNEAAIHAANAAVRIALLINGGAAVSVLAVIGGLVSQKLVPVSELGKIASGLMWFTSGVALAGGAAGLAYFTSYFIAGSSVKRERMWEHPYVKDARSSNALWWLALFFQLSGIVCGLLSLGSFIVGMMTMYAAITGIK
jgi:hypothetical protein